jgi:O-acetyl-ADP-ribose deacetylase (regulator of RNase III)
MSVPRTTAKLNSIKGDIFKTNSEALVNPVNCDGFMGKGVALKFKMAFPDNFNEYQKKCQNNELRPGKLFIYATGSISNPRYIVNFPTKRHWREKSRLEDISAGLKTLIEEIQRHDIKSIAIPALGCGLGGLLWPDVRLMIEHAFMRLPDVDVILFEPLG